MQALDTDFAWALKVDWTIKILIYQTQLKCDHFGLNITFSWAIKKREMKSNAIANTGIFHQII